ncbi:MULTISPECIES: aldose epimerase family protein [Streptomyces]|uniref:aldose epimerase family protein n=1 Tax=Streptomyces TaxID=1883 RepID=UPI002381870E|nr:MULTISPECIES: aldose epimerase family protein [Streptomyces]MDX2744074.1 galactose mutarotase [Streptomyces sp. NRRL_B-2557]MDX3061332.1 galactose mutarotase [Streptomyces sp. ND04-05B]WRY81933.1 galactose mutarotase [Streptomyces clavifer]WUC27693.1 galactose mutarotase [Streptomyces clavifer]
MIMTTGTAVHSEDFTPLADGTAVRRWTLERDGTRVRVLTYGAVVQSVEVPGRDGTRAGVALGLPDTAGYETYAGPYFGALVGRYANRIGGASFVLDGRTHQVTPNEGRNHVHGGTRGFDKRVWDAEEVPDGVRLSLVAEDGEEGFPGRLEVSVAYTLDAGGALRIGYRATTDAPTVLNLTNHTYWNLAGADSGSALGHELRLAGSRITPADAESIPTGEFAPVDGTRFDFREPKPVGPGYDTNYVLDETGDAPAAELYDAASGRVLTVTTTEPGLQLYTADHFEGRPFVPCAGIALETQHFPDSPNRPEFPSTVLRPGEEFVSTTVYGFSVR